MNHAQSFVDLVKHFESLPGIGPKSAQRIVFHIVMKMNPFDVTQFANTLEKIKETLQFCEQCNNLSDNRFCHICADHQRDQNIICVVADPKDIAAIERSKIFKGLYHVLHGLIDPMQGSGPENLKIKELLSRINQGVEEIILATNPTIEGDATALYLAKLINPLGIKVSRIAHGMPIGSELDYADSATLSSAMEYRRSLM